MTEQNAEAVPRQILLQRVYLKDASLEMPLAPQIFTRPWNPQIEIQLATNIGNVEPNIFQVVLAVTVTAKLGEETAFLVEAHQAGVFAVTGLSPEELQMVLSTYCANVLFPYAREAISNLVTRTGYPPVVLQPVNFEAMYAEHLARSKANSIETSVTFGEPTSALQ